MSFGGDSSLTAGQLRIAALSIAAYEYVLPLPLSQPIPAQRSWPLCTSSMLRTIPLEHSLYKSSPPMRSALFAATRYLGLAALIANASLYFSNYSPALCSAVHIIPGIFQGK
ncbi:hypothetical protein PIIN_05474 [Serendipita indica DSM 11827]|uniref:Uncharacterized protein n=1 Tax=Serendipita indica (strain DSM 11827) TaxID=1109443 RepID=G4TJP5_SERID|nr:hypothetical protein PIIN_05474 [Serendipita indica DSM 11827]